MQQKQQRTFVQDYQLVQSLTEYIALTGMVFTRRDIGFRLLSPPVVAVITGILVVLSIMLEPSNPDAHPLALLLFAVLFFIAAMHQRLRRWMEIRRGQQGHSYYIGTSIFDFAWLPNFCRANRRVARYFDPVFFSGTGIALYPVSHALAVWLVMTGISLRIFEDTIHRRNLHMDLDITDSLIVSQRQAQVIEHNEEPIGIHRQPTAGIPTGFAEDIEEHINRRKADNTETNETNEKK